MPRVFAIFLAAILASCSKAPTPSTKLKPAADTLDAKAKRIVKERALLNREVWQPEEQAQAHEATFIALWDALRAAKDKWEVFGKFPPGKLRVGVPGKTIEHDWGIRTTNFEGASREVTDWPEFLRRLRAKGTKIVQTEWHQERFTPAGDGRARSLFNFTIHAHKADKQRWNVKGQLDIEWSPDKDSTGLYQPVAITVVKLQLMERTGIVPFREAVLIDPQADRIDGPLKSTAMPLLVHDLDGNGLADILLPGANLIYWNRGGWKLERSRLCDYPAPFVNGVSLADFNGDGQMDLIVMLPGLPPGFYEGSPGGKFEDKPRKIVAGLPSDGSSYATAVGDPDVDGDLDVWVTQYKQPYVNGQFPTPYFDANDGFPSYLLINNGRGNFTNGTDAAGLASKQRRRTYSASFVDIDADGDQDLMMVNDFAGMDLYLNDGRGKFTDVTAQLGADRHSFGMSHALADFNGDGRIDVYMTGMASTTARRLEAMGLGREGFEGHQKARMLMGYGNRMLLASEKGLEQAPFNEQIARTGWSWGCTAFDFDNDGDRDLYIANGNVSSKSCKDYCTTFWRHDIYGGTSKEDNGLNLFFKESHRQMKTISWNGFEHNVLYMNEGPGGFSNVAWLLGMAHEYDSRSVVSNDLDADGRPDLLVVEQRWLPDSREVFRHYVHVLRNEWPGKRRWIGAHLEGKGISPIGAVVTLHTSKGTQVVPIVTGDSFSAQHAPTVHFGLGDAKPKSLEVRWSNGRKTRLVTPTEGKYHNMMSPRPK